VASALTGIPIDNLNVDRLLWRKSLAESVDGKIIHRREGERDGLLSQSGPRCFKSRLSGMSERRDFFEMSVKKAVVLLGHIALIASVPVTAWAGSGNGWAYQNPYPTAQTLLAVQFVTPQQGWIAGTAGTILSTQDGGINWTFQDSGTTQDLKGLAFNAAQGGRPGNPSEKTFQELQDELNKEKHKKKVVSRFEVLEGVSGFRTEDISLTLLDYSYHRLNDSDHKQPVVIMRCRRDIGKFKKEAEQFKHDLKSMGSLASPEVELPDSERTIIGLLDDVKDELITFAAFPLSVKPILQFAELRKNKPEYMILALEPVGTDLQWKLNTVIFGFDERDKNYYKLLELTTYRTVIDEDDLDMGTGYIDQSRVTWSDWINDQYREVIVSTEREALESKKEAQPTFKSKKDIYTWMNDRALSLVERIVDGKRTMNRRRHAGHSGAGVTLKDGELHSLNGRRLTSTNKTVDSYVLSPGKHYVAYSVIVGSKEEPGIYDDGDDIPQRPLHHVIVMDLDTSKVIRKITPPSENEPWIYADRWVSDEELVLYDADGFAVGRHYFYHAGINALRRGNFGDLQDME